MYLKVGADALLNFEVNVMLSPSAREPGPMRLDQSPGLLTETWLAARRPSTSTLSAESYQYVAVASRPPDPLTQVPTSRT